VATVTVAASSGTYTGAPSSRATVIELVTDDTQASAVTLGGSALTEYTSKASFDAASSGCWAHLPEGTFHDDDEETIMKPGLVAMLTMLGVSRFDNEDAAISEGYTALKRRKDEEAAEAAAEPAEDMVDPAEH